MRVGASWWRRLSARYDWLLLTTIVLLAGLGLLNLYSATIRSSHSIKFYNQVFWIAIAFAVYFVVGYFDYRAWGRLAWAGLSASIGTLVVLRFVGHGEGAQRWIDLGIGHFQPSEVAKIAVIVALARLLQDSSDPERRRPGETALGALALSIPVLLIAMQPDLGTATLVCLIVASVCLLQVRKLWPVAVAAPIAVALLPVLWDYMLPYQRKRVLSFLDPTSDPTDSGWHAQQSIFAIGSGKLTGKGFLNATQNHFNFLPEYWTDFPFAVWAEEWGFVGSVLLLCAFGWLILWMVNVAANARDTFGTALTLGVAAMIFWHVVVNLAMVLGMAPVVGITLPLISYGGSSLATMLVGLALVSSVSVRRRT
jgi:rod shape determining protein RodA